MPLSFERYALIRRRCCNLQGAFKASFRSVGIVRMRHMRSDFRQSPEPNITCQVPQWRRRIQTTPMSNMRQTNERFEQTFDDSQFSETVRMQLVRQAVQTTVVSRVTHATAHRRLAVRLRGLWNVFPHRTLPETSPVPRAPVIAGP